MRWFRSSPGRQGTRPPQPAGFTLLELLAVLALMALVSAVLVGSADLLRAAARGDAEEAALAAVARARHEAVLNGRTLELRLDAASRSFDWGTGRSELAGADTVHLLPPAVASAVLVGGRRVEEPLARVRFYADGTCDPFRVEILPADGRPARTVTIDPWTAVALAARPEGRR